MAAPPAGPTATLSSMTGFARASAEGPQGGLAWEIKGVNGKGLDLRLRVPPALDAEEARFRTRIAAAVSRGTCNATLTVQRPPRPAHVRVDGALLRALADAVAEAVPARAGVLGPATLDGLLSVRGVVDVVEADEPEAERQALADAAAGLLDTVLDRFRSAREAEGAALGAVIKDRVGRIASLTEAAERAPGRAPDAVRDRLARTVALLLDGSAGLDPNRLHQEAVLLAARADVREEIDRLRVHAATIRDLLDAGGPVGRKLDFLAQELGREANTLCAKSNDAALTAIGLDLRGTIEQVREQVQNLE